MTVFVDPTTELGLVRNLVGDVDINAQILTDPEYSGILQVLGGAAFSRSRLLTAASMVVQRIATNKGLLARARKLYILSIDDTKAIPVLMEISRRFKDEAMSETVMVSNPLSLDNNLVAKWITDRTDYDSSISSLFDNSNKLSTT